MWPYSLIDWGMVLDWVSLLVRWTHVVAGIAWIGSSFYFIALDASLKPDPRLDRRVSGEAWQVHGGGFYQIQKYVVAPEFLPPHLTWFKWEAYSTWIFGFVLLVLVYYCQSRPVSDRHIGRQHRRRWTRCRSRAFSLVARLARLRRAVPLVDRPGDGTPGGHRLRAAGADHLRLHPRVQRPRRVHPGRRTGRLDHGRQRAVHHHSQPAQDVAALLAGREPDPIWGYQAKQRSIHNNYLTLPVVFTMLCNHYSFTYRDAVELAGAGLHFRRQLPGAALVQHDAHRRGTRLAAVAGGGGADRSGAMLLTAVRTATAPATIAPSAALPATFAEVQHIVHQRCHVCHSAHPDLSRHSPQPPKGVMFDTPAQIAMLSQQIYAQAVKTHAMPLNNITAHHRSRARRAGSPGSPTDRRTN